MRRVLTIVGLAILGVPGLALAQAAAAPPVTGSWNAPFGFLAAGIGLGIAAGLCGLRGEKVSNVLSHETQSYR